MAMDIGEAFTKQFESEVHTAYQRMGSFMKPAIRVKTAVKGASTTFQKVGTGTAGSKTRHGKVPVMNADHTPVECLISDFYAGDWVDKLDELKINHDERAVVANAGAYALGRKTDSLIVNAARSGLPIGQKVAVAASGLTKAKCFAAVELLDAADVPSDGQRFGAVGPHQWSELMNIPQFASADYVGDADPPFKNSRMEMRYWQGVWWINTQSMLNETKSGTTRFCLVFHRTAIGWADNGNVTADVTWHGDYAAYFVNNMMTGGSVRIDDLGVVEIACDDTATIT